MRLALPRDFTARYGAGLRRGVVLGGGGVWFVAWQTGYLRRLSDLGIHLGDADRFVGTSAGSVMASILSGERIRGFGRTVDLLAAAPRLIAALAPAGTLAPSQLHALDTFRAARDCHPETLRAIGFAALAAHTPSRESTARNLGLLLRMRRWPSSRLHITCVDTYTGERCVITQAIGVHITRAVAASSAVPGIFAPQQIRDRRCMDGGVSGTGVHLDLVAGAERALVISLLGATRDDTPWGTMAPGDIEREQESLTASGTRVLRLFPQVSIPEDLMDPGMAAQAVTHGARQADADADAIRSFWA